MAQEIVIQHLNSEINRFTLEISDKKKILCITVNKSKIDKELSELERAKWRVENELKELLQPRLPNQKGLNHPDHYDCIPTKSTIRCKYCKNEGDDTYLFHRTDCQFAHMITSVKYYFALLPL
jgi:hypothetical protein